MLRKFFTVLLALSALIPQAFADHPTQKSGAEIRGGLSYTHYSMHYDHESDDFYYHLIEPNLSLSLGYRFEHVGLSLDNRFGIHVRAGVDNKSNYADEEGVSFNHDHGLTLRVFIPITDE